MLKLHDLVNLYISSENRYYYSLGGVLIEGTVATTGNTLTFTPDKVGNLPPAEFEKKRAKDRKRVAGDPGTASTGEISSDGKTLTIFDATKASSLVFKRKETDFRRTGQKTVSGPEADRVGTYKMTLDNADTPNQDPGPMKATLDSSKLKLDQDNTFSMASLAGVIEGTWTMKGETLTLSVKRANGSADVPVNAPIVLTLKGADLYPEQKDAKEIKFKFVKE